MQKPTDAYQAALFIQSYLDSHPWLRKTLDNSSRRELSGIGRGMGSDGGDPGQGSSDSRKGQYSRDKESRQWRDEGRIREDKSGKKEPLGPLFISTME